MWSTRVHCGPALCSPHCSTQLHVIAIVSRPSNKEKDRSKISVGPAPSVAVQPQVVLQLLRLLAQHAVHHLAVAVEVERGAVLDALRGL